MLTYIVRRVLIAIPTLIATSIVVFLLVRLMPGNVIDFITQGTVTLDPSSAARWSSGSASTGRSCSQYWPGSRGSSPATWGIRS